MKYDFDSNLIQIIGNILSLKNPGTIDDLSNEEGFSALISNLEIPSYSLLETIQRKESLKRCKTASKYFLEYPLNFVFSEEAITFIINNQNNISQKLVNYYTYFIIYSFLSWIQQYLTNNDDSNILTILNALLVFKNQVCFECFFAVFYICITTKPQQFFDTLYPIIENIYIKIDSFPVPDYAFQLLPIYFSNILKGQEEFTVYSSQLMNLLKLILLEYRNKITNDIATDLYISIKPFAIDKFDILGLTFFVDLFPFLPSEMKNESISIFPSKIIKLIEKNSEEICSTNSFHPFQLPNHKQSIQNYSIIKSIEMYYRFNKENSTELSHDFDINLIKKVSYPAISLGNLCDSRITAYLSLVHKIIGNDFELLQEFLNYFSDIIKTRDIDSLSYTIISSYVRFCQMNQSSFKIIDMNEIILKYLIWTPEYIIIKYDPTLDEPKIVISDDEENLNALRHYSLFLVLNQTTSSIDNFIQSINSSPLLICEFCLRIISNNNLFKLLTSACLDSDKIIRTFCITFRGYSQKLHDKSTAYDQNLDKAREIIFCLLSKLLEVNEISFYFYNDAIFLSFFFGLLFEEKLQDFVFNEIKLFLNKIYLLSNEVATINSPISLWDNRNRSQSYFNQISEKENYIIQKIGNFIQSFHHMFEQCLSQFSQKEGRELSNKIFHNLFDIFENVRMISKKFTFMIPIFCDTIENYNKNEEIINTESNLKYIDLIFQFITYLEKSDFTIEMVILIKNMIISNGIVKCDNNLFNLIQKAMIHDEIITQPLFAKLFIFCFWQNDAYYKRIIDLFCKLCQSNSTNSIALHEAEIDYFIVEDIKKNLNTFTETEITSRLGVLEQISLIISSPMIVQNYISLLKESTIFLDFMNKLIEKNYSIPISILPFNIIIDSNDRRIYTNSNPFKKTSGTFSFVIWLYVENDKSPISILSINQNDVNVSIKKQELYVNNTFIFEIPLKKWFFLALTFQEDKILTAHQNLVPPKTLSFVWPNNEGNPVPYIDNFKIGGTETNILNGRFGNFGFLQNLNKLNIRYFVEAGPRNLSDLKDQNFTVVDYFNQERLSDIRATFLKTAQIVNFAENFLQICKIDLILPLFAQIDDKNHSSIDNYMKNERCNKIFKILRNSLLADEDQQKYFHKIHGFSIIAHLLISTNFKGLTFDFYYKFFSLCQEIADVNLRNDIIKDILINFDLWTRSSDFLKITIHWKNVLFAGFEFIYQELISFADLLGLMRIYLYYEPCEKFATNLINQDNEAQNNKEIKPRPACENITEIRENILEIMANQYQGSLTVYDLALLMSHCISCKDVRQVHDLLLFFSTLVDSNIGKVLHEFMMKTEAYIGLHSLLIMNDPLIVPTAVCLIRAFCRSNLIKDFTFPEMMLTFMHQLKYSDISESVLEKLIICIHDDCPELFSVCCYFSLHIDIINMKNKNVEQNSQLLEFKQFKMLFLKIEPSEELCCSPIWAVWAVFGAILSNDSSILLFLAKCTKKWSIIFSIIDRICDVFETNPIPDFPTVSFNSDEWKAKFITVLLEFCEQFEFSNIGELIDISSFFIFFRKKQLHNKALLSVYNNYINQLKNNSEINDLTNLFENYEISQLLYISNTQSDTTDRWHQLIKERIWLSTKLNDENIDQQYQYDIEGKIMDRIFHEFLFNFGLRFNENGTWVDKEIAIRTLKLINKYNLEQKNNAKLILSYFCFPVDKREKILLTQDHINSIFNRDLCNLSYYIFRDIRSFSIHDCEKASSLFSCDPNILKQYGINKLEDTWQNIVSSNEVAVKYWRFLWSHMTIDHAPWDPSSSGFMFIDNINDAKSFEFNKKHYKRDFTLNTMLCPWKTKINTKFDIHELASKMRDSGVFEEENEEEKLKKKRLAMHPLSVINDDIVPQNTVEKSQTLELELNNSNIIFTHECEVIKISKIVNLTFTMTKKFIKVGNKIFKIEDIWSIFWRRRKQYPTAIEIYFIYGKTIFLNFPGLKGEAVVNKIAPLLPKSTGFVQQANFDAFFNASRITEKWQDHKISNFEYLMYLNVFSGRSFNDSSQYPIIPWILINFTDKKIDLNDEKNYRDLTKPMGALGQERLDELIKRLADLRYFEVDEFLYSCYASTPLEVFLFNVRVEPYTTQHIEIQGGRFDTPMRIFFSIQKTFESAITQMNDYRELIPEFYYDNQFLLNLNNFDLGLIDKTISISDVELPPWASNSMEYVYLNRKALESDIVSEKLNNWIDLFFGEKQRGEKAKESNNLYKMEMYDDVWEKMGDVDDGRRLEIETIIEQVGQIPPQLFKNPHPTRNPWHKRVSILNNTITKEIQISKGSVIYAISREIDYKAIRIKMITTAGTIETIDFEFANEIIWDNKVSIREFNKELVFAPDSKNFIELISTNTNSNNSGIFSLYSNYYNYFFGNKGINKSSDYLFYITNSNLDAHITNVETLETVKVNDRKQIITSIATSDETGNWMSLSLGNGRTNIFQNSTLSFSVPTYRQQIKCSALHSEFGVSISGTNDGALIVASLLNGSTIRAISLQEGFIPLNLCITPKWGFIIVNSSKYIDGRKKFFLSLFTINGDEIKTINMESSVEKFKCLSSSSGFDYVIMSTKNGKISIFEAFYLEKEKVLYKSFQKIISFDFLKQMNIIVAVCENGSVIMIPCLYDEIEY